MNPDQSVSSQEYSAMSTEGNRKFEYTDGDFICHTASWADKNAPQLSKFDVELQERWDHAMANGAFRYDISNIQTRILPGPSGYVAQLNTLRAIQRRSPQKITSVKQPFNPKEFNFNKVKSVEVIFDLTKLTSGLKKDIPNGAINGSINGESEKNSNNNETRRNGCSLETSDCCDSGSSSRSSSSSGSFARFNGVIFNSENGQQCCNGHSSMNDVNGSSETNHDRLSSNGSICDSDRKQTGSGRTAQESNGPKKDTNHMIVINVSPMEYGHCLLVPSPKECLPQVMTEESIAVAIQTMLLSRHRGLRLGFNSLCAFASVNHLHYHMFYLEYELISDYCHVRHLAGMYHEYTALPCPGFALQLYGNTVEELARQAYRISNYLYENDTAHNMFMCRGVVFGEERNSKLTTIRLFIWPRKKIVGSKSSEEFNVACIELVGHLPVKIEDGYHNLTEPDVNAILAEACLPQSEYEAIKAKVVEMGKMDCSKVNDSVQSNQPH